MSGIRYGLFRFSLLLIYISILFYGVQYQDYLQLLSGRTTNLIPLFVYSLLFPAAYGMLLALPKFYVRLRQKGKWIIDWSLLLPIALPTLIISILPILLFFTPIGSMFRGGFLYSGYGVSYIFYYCVRFVFGYTVLNSFKKISRESSGTGSSF